MEEGTEVTDIIITGLVVPKTANAPDAAEFRAMVDIGNAMARADVGTADLDDTVESLLPAWHDQSDRLSRGFVARRDGEIVGAAVADAALPRRSRSTGTRPIGSAVLDAASGLPR